MKSPGLLTMGIEQAMDLTTSRITEKRNDSGSQLLTLHQPLDLSIKSRIFELENECLIQDLSLRKLTNSQITSKESSSSNNNIWKKIESSIVKSDNQSGNMLTLSKGMLYENKFQECESMKGEPNEHGLYQDFTSRILENQILDDKKPNFLRFELIGNRNNNLDMRENLNSFELKGKDLMMRKQSLTGGYSDDTLVRYAG